MARLEAVKAEWGAGTAAPSPSPQPVAPSVMLIPELQLGGGLGGQNNRCSAGANRAVQVGPGQTVDSIAEDLRQGNYRATDLDK